MSTTRKNCPRCGNKYVFRSHRHSLEKPFLELFRLSPLRCDACDKRFYARIDQPADPAGSTTILTRTFNPGRRS